MDKSIQPKEGNKKNERQAFIEDVIFRIANVDGIMNNLELYSTQKLVEDLAEAKISNSPFKLNEREMKVFRKYVYDALMLIKQNTSTEEKESESKDVNNGLVSEAPKLITHQRREEPKLLTHNPRPVYSPKKYPYDVHEGYLSNFNDGQSGEGNKPRPDLKIVKESEVTPESTVAEPQVPDVPTVSIEKFPKKTGYEAVTPVDIGELLKTVETLERDSKDTLEIVQNIIATETGKKVKKEKIAVESKDLGPRIEFLDYCFGDFDFYNEDMALSMSEAFAQIEKGQESGVNRLGDVLEKYFEQNSNIFEQIYLALPNSKKSETKDPNFQKNNMFFVLEAVQQFFKEKILFSVYFRDMLAKQDTNPKKLFLTISYILYFMLEDSKEWKKMRNKYLNSLKIEDVLDIDPTFLAKLVEDFRGKFLPASDTAKYLILSKLINLYVRGDSVFDSALAPNIIVDPTGRVHSAKAPANRKFSFETMYYFDDEKRKYMVDNMIRDILLKFPIKAPYEYLRLSTDSTKKRLDKFLQLFAAQFFVCDMRDFKQYE